MKPNLNKPRPKNSLRLKGYDYSQSGAYFVTTVTHQRECLFGEIENGIMRLNNAGKIVQTVWLGLPNHYSHVELGAFIIMPNHAHGIIIIHDIVKAGLRPALTTKPKRQHGLSEIMRAFKSFSSRRIHETDQFSPEKIWQRGFHDRIIRNEDEWSRIHLYIESNSINWQEDHDNPINFQQL